MKSPRNSPDSSFSKDDNPTIAGPPSSTMYSLPTPHPDFWLYDGSIVLSVESCLFRVHQTILANHSEIFSDLFTLPQPVEDEEAMIEGCRIVHLPDSESDFVDLLKAIYRPECVPLHPRHSWLLSNHHLIFPQSLWFNICRYRLGNCPQFHSRNPPPQHQIHDSLSPPTLRLSFHRQIPFYFGRLHVKSWFFNSRKIQIR